MTPEEFLEKLKGPNILVRLELIQTDKTIVMAHGCVYAYMNDDGDQYAAEITYRCNSHGVFRELSHKSFPNNPRNWARRAHGFMNESKPLWWHNREIVCTYRLHGGDTHVLKPSNPLALTHLARFEGMLFASAGNQDEITADLYAIAARRLGGLVRGLAMEWTKLV